MSPSATGTAGRAHGREIEQRAIHEMRRHDVAQRAEDRVDAARIFLLPLAQHRRDLLALQVLLRAAQRCTE